MGAALAVAAAVVVTVALFLAAGWLLRHRLRGWFVRELKSLTGPSIIDVMPPRDVLCRLLGRIYGEDSGFESVLVGVLGGAGLDPEGRDLAASRRTTADFRVRTIDDSTCSVVVTWTHRLSRPVHDRRFVVFTTCDSGTWNVVSRERLTPLYESWFIPEEVFERAMHDSLEIGISYVDDAGRQHDVAPRPIESEPVKVKDYPKYVRLPAHVDPHTLRILEFDLGELFSDDHVVRAVHGLSVRSEGKEPLGDGFITWSPPYPCFVDEVTYDVDDLVMGPHPLVFKAVSFTMKADRPITHDWGSAADVRRLRIGSWLLPGHGVALLWKPADQVEPYADPRRE